VTLQLLWEEHCAAHPNGYGYSRFCNLYRAWGARLSPTMRQTHVVGEWLFVDYSPRHPGDCRPCHSVAPVRIPCDYLRHNPAEWRVAPVAWVTVGATDG
jgi:transposase